VSKLFFKRSSSGPGCCFATYVQRDGGFFSGVIPETIQLRNYAGFSQADRCPQVLDLVPFVERSAQKVNDFDMLHSDSPAGGSFERSHCTH
jgi:hypothetical protein